MALTANVENPKRVKGATRICADFARKEVRPGGAFDVYSNEDISALSRILQPRNFFYCECEMPNGRTVWMASDGVNWHDASSESHAKSLSNFEDEAPKLRARFEEGLERKAKRKSRQLIVMQEGNKVIGADPEKVAELEKKLEELQTKEPVEESASEKTLKAEIAELKKQNGELKKQNAENLSIRSDFDALKEQVEAMAMAGSKK